MADSFFDLGKTLPKVDAAELIAHLGSSSEIFERAFTPSSVLGDLPDGAVHQFKGKIFKRMRFYRTRFVRINFTQCIFDECLFLSAIFEDCEFHDCRFIRCNTHKFQLVRTYLDPRSFVRDMFDKNQYANVGVDLFQMLLKNSVDESQPDFRDMAEYHFRLWQRYNQTSYWRGSAGANRWLNLKFYGFWIWDVLYQKIFGYGVRTRNILFWTPVLFLCTWAFNLYNWDSFGIEAEKLKTIPIWGKSAFYTVGALSTFGTGDLNPTTGFGLTAVSVQVVAGITWIALSTAMIVKRFVR